MRMHGGAAYARAGYLGYSAAALAALKLVLAE